MTVSTPMLVESRPHDHRICKTATDFASCCDCAAHDGCEFRIAEMLKTIEPERKETGLHYNPHARVLRLVCGKAICSREFKWSGTFAECVVRAETHGWSRRYGRWLCPKH